MIIYLYLCLCHAFMLVYLPLFVIYIYACVVPSLSVYLVMLWICATLSSRRRVGLALVLMLLCCRLGVVCCLSMDRAFEPVERAVCLNVAIVSLSCHGRNTEHSPFSRVLVVIVTR